MDVLMHTEACNAPLLMLTREGAFPLSSASPQNYSLDWMSMNSKVPNGRGGTKHRGFAGIKSFKVRRGGFASRIKKNSIRTLKYS